MQKLNHQGFQVIKNLIQSEVEMKGSNTRIWEELQNANTDEERHLIQQKKRELQETLMKMTTQRNN